MLHDADRNRILHMLEAAQQAVLFIQGRSRSDLDSDAQLRLALLRSLEVLGEAAARVSAELREAHPEIPWRKVANTRNRLIHAYFDVNLDIVWSTVCVAVPDLVPKLERLISRTPPRIDRPD
jgi:uncharacterized protein with HEPN domain